MRSIIETIYDYILDHNDGYYKRYPISNAEAMPMMKYEIP